MSRETLTHLNNFTLIGNTDARGNAWHYRAALQGEEPNHYPGPIPIDDVKRRLYYWQPVPRRVAVEFPADLDTMTHLGDDGEPLRWMVQEDRQAIARSDRATVLGMFKGGYKIHQYEQWLLEEHRDDLGRRPGDLLGRTAPRRRGRVGRGQRARHDHHPGGCRLPPEPARRDVGGRFAGDHDQAHGAGHRAVTTRSPSR